MLIVYALFFLWLFSKAVNNAYEEFVLNVGDFDERIFLGDDAAEEIGTPAKTAQPAELSERMQVKKNLQQHMDRVSIVFWEDTFQFIVLARRVSGHHLDI